MTPARFQTIEQIYREALKQKPSDLDAFLDKTCEGDEGLRRKVEALLNSRQRADGFIESSAVGLAARIIQNGDADSLIGQTIGHYKICESIGAGGMGEVYLATDIVAGRRAALKLLPLQFTGDAERLKRFEQESRAVVGLNHPNIVTVYEIGEQNSIHYIASELIEGETLRDRLARGPMQLNESLEVAIQVASALAAAHQAGIVHRDIKPENIMLRPDGYAKVLDFGIAKLAESAFAEATADAAGSTTLAQTHFGSILGTARYMSPEQASGAPVDKRTDIWSLGVVLYEMVSGHAPFTGDLPSQQYGAAGTPQEVMSLILEKEPPPVTRYVARAPVELQQIISKALRKDPAQRYNNAHELLHALKELRRKLEFKLQRAAAPLWLRWARSPAVLVLGLIVAGLAMAFPFYWHRTQPTSLPSEKSIAVLPLQNLSEDKENAFFADGVQDELLSNLSKIKDLKVISRTSVMQYKSGTRRNLKEIAQQLGVSNVVEGSVRRSGDHVRVSVQLIDTRTDRHLWAENYDRKVADSVSLQGELATDIASAVGATLTPQEKARVEVKPTNNPAAYDAYLRARAIPFDWGFALKGDIESAIHLYEQAVKLDPNFTLAWAYLSIAQIQIAGKEFGWPAQSARAKDSLNHALALDPNLPEVHLARGYNEQDYTRALAELRQAEQGLPNSVDVIEAIARMQRALGHWDEAVADLRRGIELDPRNISASNNLALTYCAMRRFPEALATVDRVLAWDPTNARALLTKADALMAIGDLQAAEPLLANPEFPAARRVRYALFQRNYAAAIEILSKDLAVDRQQRDPEDILLLAFSQQLAGDIAAARATYQKAIESFRRQLENVTPASFFEADIHMGLAKAYAGLGEAASAVAEGEKAMALLPSSKNPQFGPDLEADMAGIYAQLGDADHAIPMLKRLLRTPHAAATFLTPATLRLDPLSDKIRNDPRFQELTLEEVPVSEKSIAVLPFIDLSETKDQEYFCDGMSEEIINALAKVEALHVVSRTSSFSFKGKGTDVNEIGKKLNVENVLEGSLRREGNRVRVTAELVNTRSGFHLWTETYDRELTGVFALQDEITRSIVDALKIKLAVALPAQQQRNMEVYDLYLQGLYFSNRSSEENLRRALNFFQRAVEKDPTFSRAWTGIAKAWYFLADVYVKPLEAYQASKEAALKAIAIDENDAEAHCYLSEAKRVLDWDLEGADTELKRALQLDPNSAPAHLFLSMQPLFRGELQEGLRLVLAAERLDPVSPITSYVATAAYLANDRIDDAINEGQRTLLLDPNYFYLDSNLAAAYREKGNFAEAIALYIKSQEATHLPSSGLAITYTRMGRETEARTILAQLLQAKENRYVSAPVIAAVYVAFGDKEEAFRWLERGFAEHSGILQWIAFLPEFRSLHSDARFPDLLRRISGPQDTILKITETTLSEISDPNAQTHLTLKVGVKPRPGTQNGHVVRIKVDFYDLTKDNRLTLTNAKVSYNWLSSGRDWTDPAPKFLAATYIRPKSKLPSPDERRFGGFVVSVYFDGQLQDSRASPSELSTFHPAQN